jgi:hypothetical protein
MLCSVSILNVLVAINWLRGFRLSSGYQDQSGLGTRQTVDQKPFDPGGTSEIASFCRSYWISVSCVPSPPSQLEQP